jgi:hypothetical protein
MNLFKDDRVEFQPVIFNSVKYTVISAGFTI